jgi:outer membrane receptor for monomeric catechols
MVATRMASYRVNSHVAIQLNGYNLANRYYFANSYFTAPVENHVAPGAPETVRNSLNCAIAHTYSWTLSTPPY